MQDALAAEAVVLVAGVSEALRQEPHPGLAELCLVREADGSHSLGMLLRFAEVPRLEGRFRCQAFLFEPEIIQRLEGLLGGRPYLDAFTPDAVTNILDVARILSVVSDLDGEWASGDDEIRFRRQAVPVREDLFPPRAEPLPVVVVMHPAEQ